MLPSYCRTQLKTTTQPINQKTMTDNTINNDTPTTHQCECACKSNSNNDGCAPECQTPLYRDGDSQIDMYIDCGDGVYAVYLDETDDVSDKSSIESIFGLSEIISDMCEKMIPLTESYGSRNLVAAQALIDYALDELEEFARLAGNS